MLHCSHVVWISTMYSTVLHSFPGHPSDSLEDDLDVEVPISLSPNFPPLGLNTYLLPKRISSVYAKKLFTASLSKATGWRAMALRMLVNCASRSAVRFLFLRPSSTVVMPDLGSGGSAG
jgi:hypothetical protein